jgi:hypothetical protein
MYCALEEKELHLTSRFWFGICLRKLRKMMKTSVRITGALGEICTGPSQTEVRCVNLLGSVFPLDSKVSFFFSLYSDFHSGSSGSEV